jgi:opacity protein-like surface antigen
MIRICAILVLLVVAFAPLRAQNDTQTTHTTIIVKDEIQYKNYYTIRLGLWFPKDKEKEFTYENVTHGELESTIDQSQALGLDFHYRKDIGRPLFFDFAVQFWYSSYDFKPSDLWKVGQDTIRNANAWYAVIPVTAGLSFAPLPEGMLQPYVMAGVGGYLGITGTEVYINNNARHNDDDVQFVFGGFIGAGCDVLLSQRFGLSAALKYQFVEFKEPLLTQQKNLTGLQVMLGIVSNF